jgi:hypothetical protein
MQDLGQYFVGKRLMGLQEESSEFLPFPFPLSPKTYKYWDLGSVTEAVTLPQVSWNKILYFSYI